MQSTHQRVLADIMFIRRVSLGPLGCMEGEGTKKPASDGLGTIMLGVKARDDGRCFPQMGCGCFADPFLRFFLAVVKVLHRIVVPLVHDVVQAVHQLLPCFVLLCSAGKNDEKCSIVAPLHTVEYITDALVIEGCVFQQCAENSYNGMSTILRQLFPARCIAVEQC